MYRATRARILSPLNKFYFSGRTFTGLGSPHTPERYIWPLAHMVDALTTEATPAGEMMTPETRRQVAESQNTKRCVFCYPSGIVWLRGACRMHDTRTRNHHHRHCHPTPP